MVDALCPRVELESLKLASSLAPPTDTGETDEVQANVKGKQSYGFTSREQLSL